MFLSILKFVILSYHFAILLKKRELCFPSKTVLLVFLVYNVQINQENLKLHKIVRGRVFYIKF